MNSIKHFPFDIKDVDSETTAKLCKYFSGESAYVRIGPKQYFMPRSYKEEAANIYNMSVRSDDIFIVTYPRTGTTWTSEMIWLIENNLDYEAAAAVPLVKRFPYMDFQTLFNEVQTKRIYEHNKNDEDKTALAKFLLGGSKVIENLPSPRFIKTHLPMSLLPPSMLDTAKVVYVARNPQDVAVSYYNLSKLFITFGYNGDFKTFWEFFKNDRPYSPYIEHVKEAWEMRNHPNMLFLFYEDLVKDLPGAINRMATFLDKKLTKDQVEKLCKHLSIESFKANSSVDGTAYKSLGFLATTAQPFIRKGKSQGWYDHFDEEMAADAERWIAENLQDTDLRFPNMTK
ncbi:estrogen sulfotransferase-like [Hyposmocoma kahamanoa]|uniref:estrogen sulfotransferase-like n=1 Tax=Hyposmocoma kahamanoa TaxID=1477025 RepID=UPI000E6D8835|nr:estrogen sulfotransferase-like [Hyposmocoma kahamanoa]